MCLAVAVLSGTCLPGEFDKSETAIGLLWRSCWDDGLASSSSASMSVTSPGHLCPCTKSLTVMLAISIVLTSAMVVVLSGTCSPGEFDLTETVAGPLERYCNLTPLPGRRGHVSPAAMIVPPSMSSPLLYVIFTKDSKGVRCWYWALAIVLGPWSNRDAMTNAAILDLQLTAFWRHLCDDALRRQSRAPGERQGTDAALKRCSRGCATSS